MPIIEASPLYWAGYSSNMERSQQSPFEIVHLASGFRGALGIAETFLEKRVSTTQQQLNNMPKQSG
ncbi:hypothetical protein HYFRA_00011957 [Hymenoscyphus fraxineus]|uniref:Uncharacterized protein n=1 Tax=Hymenoscyphus fraxineus TaxID=746836 RepID=A0A9N9PR93_9HELO|nr:hypothetical protein HYFRA_00011957 [Hymenoscyphus fraxineus]